MSSFYARGGVWDNAVIPPSTSVIQDGRVSPDWARYILHALDALLYEMTDDAIRPLEAFARWLLEVGCMKLEPGFIIISATTARPAGWMECDGRAVSRTLYADLFAKIGTTYGTGDGSTTFNLPNLGGRAVVGVEGATEQGLTQRMPGARFGSETHTLQVSELPAHAHRFHPSTNVSLIRPVAGGTLAWGSGPLQGEQYTQTQPTGGGESHNNIPPSIALHFYIWTGKEE